MKYLVSWKIRGGGSGEENETAAARSLAVFAKWSPADDATFHQFLTRLDGEGGFAVVETDNPASILEGPAKFGPWFEFTVTPVMDIMDGIAVQQQAIDFRRSVT